jgi:hypothetical protein
LTYSNFELENFIFKTQPQTRAVYNQSDMTVGSGQRRFWRKACGSIPTSSKISRLAMGCVQPSRIWGTDGQVTRQFKKGGGGFRPTFHLKLIPKLQNNTQPTWCKLRNYNQLIGGGDNTNYNVLRFLLSFNTCSNYNALPP